MTKTLATLLLISVATPALAWSGTDQNGNSVQIDRGQTVRRNRDIDVYNYGTGKYQNYTVESIRSRGRGAEIEVYDSQTGQYDTLNMDN